MPWVGKNWHLFEWIVTAASQFQPSPANDATSSRDVFHLFLTRVFLPLFFPFLLCCIMPCDCASAFPSFRANNAAWLRNACRESWCGNGPLCTGELCLSISEDLSLGISVIFIHTINLMTIFTLPRFEWHSPAAVVSSHNAGTSHYFCLSLCCLMRNIGISQYGVIVLLNAHSFWHGTASVVWLQPLYRSEKFCTRLYGTIRDRVAGVCWRVVW